MNVVGKVGSLISQGVYCVATPFHPFGGAVDAIVVQQQDGTFRSTPWYVRFGKFQGVLKGAEKIVRIAVNDIEANFHMYLDNSGEAYFIREVDYGKGNETDGVLKEDSGEVTQEDAGFGNNGNDIENNAGAFRLEHSVSDSGVDHLRDEFDSSGGDRIGRTESDGNRRYFEFHDEQSSLEGSVGLPEYGSSGYENLDGEHSGESQGSNSEVILVSVDGHILTAPILASEQNTDIVQLNTPQFHLVPGDGAEFCEDNGEFTSGDNAWADDYMTKLNPSTANEASDNVCSMNNDDNAFFHQLKVCEGVDEHVCQTSETKNVARHEGDPHMHSDSEDASASIKRGDVFKSCLELPDLVQHVENADFEETGPVLEAQHSREKSPQTLKEVDKTEDEGVIELGNNDVLSSSCSSDSPGNSRSRDLPVEVETTEKCALGIENVGPDSISVTSTNDPEWKGEQLGTSAATEGINGSLQRPESEVDCSGSEIVELQTATSAEGIQAFARTRFEISLCRNELHAGMGPSAAAEVFDAHRISPEDYKSSAASILKNKNLIVRLGERYVPWEEAAPVVLGMAAFGLDLPVEPKDAIPVELDDISKPKDDDSVITSTPSGRRWTLWPIPFRRVKTLEHTSSTSSSEEVFVDSESGVQNLQAERTPASHGCSESPRKQFLRTNVPNNEQIASLNLKDGQNVITFSFSTRVLGKQQVDAHIYLWKWNARIVISDVDGTITKSDVLGQFMPLVGKDWTQSGVARLFSAIKENGYQLLFLSARAIVQAYLTRSFLVNLKQDGKTLPNGPVVISPDGLFPSLYREVIRRAPHEFKIACLEDIKKLFPSDYNPFYAGFGNRDTDELSYRKIGIPKGKIFIINPKGEVAISHHRIDVKSYTSLHTLVNDMFPPTSLVEQEDYNSWNFWRMPLPEIDS